MTISAVDRDILLTALAPRIETVVGRAVERAKATLAEYTDISGDELRAGIHADLQRALAALLEERDLTEDDRAGMGAIGDARARQGIPLEAMLQVYRFTIDEVFNGLWEASDEGAVDPARVVHLTRLIWRYADPMMDVAVQAYRHRELQQAIAEGQGRSELVHRLLRSPGGAEASAAVVTLQLDPAADYVAVRARARDAHELLLDLGTPGVLEGGAAAPHEGDVIAFARRRPATLPTASGAIVGIGPAGPLRTLPHSLAVATRVVDTAAAFGRSGLLTIDDVALAAIARTEETIGRRLAARLVDPCEPATAAGRELLDTVRMVLRHDLAVETAATALYVHANTVRNRLRRYEQLTGSSLRRVDDLCAIRLALLHAELRDRTADATPGGQS